jgi:hypothetical protein
MTLAVHVTLNIDSFMSTAAVFLDIDATWHSDLLYKLSELEFLTSLIKLIASFTLIETFKVLVEGEFSTPKIIATMVSQGSILPPILYSLYINDALAAPGTYLVLFPDDTCIYVTEKHEHLAPCTLQRGLTYVTEKHEHLAPCTLQRGLTALNSWCER